MPDTSASRTPLLAANWKMHKTVAETADFFAAFLAASRTTGPT